MIQVAVAVVGAVVHLGLAAVWFGSMAYSLTVVQPRAARFFAGDPRHEEFLMTLAHRNRIKVIPMIAGLIVTAALVALTAKRQTTTIGYAGALALYLAAAGVFADVSWRHWPARVFALPAELPALRRGLRRRAWTMVVLVGAAFGLTLVTTVGWGVR